MRSWVTPPKIIAPMRPLPTGNASVQIAAGFLYQRVSGESCANARRAWPKQPAAARIAHANAARRPISALNRHGREIAAGDDAVDHTVSNGLLRLHNVVAIDV